LEFLNTPTKDHLDLWGDALVADLRQITNVAVSIVTKKTQDFVSCD